MILDKKKKQKYQKQKRNTLHMYFHLLQQPSQLIKKIHPNISNMNILKIITTLHLNYLILTYIDTLNKANDINQQYTNTTINDIGIQQIKIGVIGGGTMGRLFINSLLVMEKIGINPSNITLSTRQYEDFESYQNQFKINVEFNNEKLAEQSDILLVTVPSSLDNWIITDLKTPLNKRRTLSPNYSQSFHPISQPKTNKNTNYINSNLATRGITLPITNTPSNSLNPMIYITTSNMTEQKLSKLFNFPIMTPIIRGEQAELLKEFVSSNQPETKNINEQFQQIEKILMKYITKSKNKTKSLLNFVFENYLPDQEPIISPTLINPKSKKSNNKPSLTQKISKTQRIQSNHSSSLNGQSINQSQQIPENVQNMVEEILTKNQNLQETFLAQCNKWRTAYNNYIQ